MTYYNTHYKAKPETMLKQINKKILDLKLGSFISYTVCYESGACTIKEKDGSKTIKQKELATITLITNEEAKKQ